VGKIIKRKSSRWHVITSYRKIILILAVLAAAPLAFAAPSFLLQSHIPPGQVKRAVVVPSCDPMSTTTQPFPVGAGAVQFNCSGGPAFSTTSGTSTPTFTGYPVCPVTVTSPCYVTFGYVPSGDTTSCATTTGSGYQALIDGTPVTFTGTGSWDYCGVYDSPAAGGTLPGFTIIWSQ